MNHSQANSLPPVVRQQMQVVSGHAYFGGALLLLFGLYYIWQGVTGVSDYPLYNLTVDAFGWLLLAGGAAMCASGLLCGLNVRSSLLIDAVLTYAVGGMLGLVGVIQIYYEAKVNGTLGLNSILLILFGGMFIRSASRSMQAHRMVDTVATREFVAAADAPDNATDGASTDAQRRDALKRLLDAKENLPTTGEKPSGSSRPAPAPSDESAPAITTPATRPDVPAKTPSSGDNADASPKPAPNGFLAALGRDDDKKD